MAINQVQGEGRYITVAAPTGGVTSGDVVLIGGLIGIAQATAAQTVDVVLDTQGVYTVACASAAVIAVGDVLYWDVADAEFNKTAAGNYKVGVATSAAGNGVTSVNIKLDGESLVVEPGV